MALSTSCNGDVILYNHVEMEKINLSNILGVPIDAEVRVDANTQLIDILDALTIVLGNRKAAQKQWEKYCFEKSEHGENFSPCSLLYWRKGGLPSAVAPAHVIVQIINQLNTKKAAHVRTAVAKDFCRKLGGDLTLANEIIEQNATVAGTIEQSVMLTGTGTSLEEANTGVKRPRASADEEAQRLDRFSHAYKVFRDLNWGKSKELENLFDRRAQNLGILYLTNLSGDVSTSDPVVLRSWTACEIALDLRYKVAPGAEI
eukprot:4765719-Pleurochrysis_carterae.AAC.1